MNDNPYLSQAPHIAWSQLSTDKAREGVKAAMGEADTAIKAIAALPLDATQLSYENTFDALETAPRALSQAWGWIQHQMSVADAPEWRELFGELMPEVVTFSSSVTLNPALYAVLKTAAEAEWVANLKPIQQRFIKETLADFRESGAELNDEQKTRYTEIAMRSATLSQEFGERALDSTNAWDYVTADEAELAGLPESSREAARLDALSKGLGTEETPQWRFTLHAPSVIPVLTFADCSSLRERVWRAYNSRGTGEFDTAAHIDEILRLRTEKAALLGYACYSDYALSRRMAGTGARALSFIDDLHDKTLAAFRAEQEAIRLYAEEQSGTSIEKMQPWSIGYWSEKRRKALYDFDSEELRPYFSMQRVMDGMFKLYSTLYGIELIERPTACLIEGIEGSVNSLPAGAVEVWHPDVQFFELKDNESGELLGSFYTDWYPRETKRAGAWMNCLRVGAPPTAKALRIPHLGLMCGNMTKPMPGKPALLTHDEVSTVFHEFGHLLHQLLSDVEIPSLAGTSVAWDFVELPSMINENWVWEKSALAAFARHWENDSEIPEELMQKMLAARNYGAASFDMRQLCFGKMDLELHCHTERYVGRNIDEVDREILADYRIPVTEMAPTMLRVFSHIFDGGYESGYYSYKWAEMLEADAFSRFKNEGILNPETGRAFRRCILSQGGSRPAAELYSDFMGRDPDPKAMLKRSGILAD